MSSHSRPSWPAWPMALGAACYHSAYVRNTHTSTHSYTSTHIACYYSLPTISYNWKEKSAFVLELPKKYISACQQYTEMGLCVFVCVQPSFAVTPVLQSVVSERGEVSSTNQKSPSVVLHLSSWSAQQPDFVKATVPGAARSLAVSVIWIIYVHFMTRQSREAIIQMKLIIQIFLGVLPDDDILLVIL